MRRNFLYILLLAMIAFAGCTTLKNESQTTGTSSSVVFPVQNTNTAITTQTIAVTTTNLATAYAIATTAPPLETNLPNGQLVRILDYIPDIIIDIRYATENNFTKKVLYDSDEAYLCYGSVKKLANVQENLKTQGFQLVIWDAYRAPEAQWKLWEVCPDPVYVANPQNGLSKHSRGNTLDLAMADEMSCIVELPSDFDEFSALSDRDYSDVSETARNHVQILEQAMSQNGFVGYWGEWWHFSDEALYEVIQP